MLYNGLACIVLAMKRRQFSQHSTYVLVASISLKSLVMVLKVAPYKFRSVSRKFCPRARLVVLHATCVVDVARVAGFWKLRRDIHARAFVGLSAGRARKLKSWFLWRHIDKNKRIFLVFPSVKFFKTSHTFL